MQDLYEFLKLIKEQISSSLTGCVFLFIFEGLNLLTDIIEEKKIGHFPNDREEPQAIIFSINNVSNFYLQSLRLYFLWTNSFLRNNGPLRNAQCRRYFGLRRLSHFVLPDYCCSRYVLRAALSRQYQ